MNDLFSLLPEDTGRPKPTGAGRPAPARRTAQAPRPLADLLRPACLEEVVGQPHLLGPEGRLTRMLEAGSLGSVILWGPPGVGKTTIARLLAGRAGREFLAVSALQAGVAELRKIFDTARTGAGTLLFVDEIHRFNRAQQDAFLPVMEDGTIVLVGATTENPSFALNAALLSRAQVLTLRALDAAALEEILGRTEAQTGRPLPLDPGARAAIIDLAGGDGRALIGLVEQVLAHRGAPLDAAALAERVSRRAAQYDRAGDGHYGLISALHKSVRASDPDAALYWLARMLKAGEDPRFLARRLTRMATEDIGLADVRAHEICLAAWAAYERLGSPEGELALAQATLYLALAPKSNAAYRAFSAARELAERTGHVPPPRHILNAPTAFMKAEGFGAGYVYDHDVEGGISGQDCFPTDVARQDFYVPTDRGEEKEVAVRLAGLREIRRRAGAAQE